MRTRSRAIEFGEAAIQFFWIGRETAHRDHHLSEANATDNQWRRAYHVRNARNHNWNAIRIRREVQCQKLTRSS